VDLNLGNKVVLVGGSTRGIGLATARAFLAEGSRTVITGRDPDTLSRARTSLESEFGPTNVLASAGDLRDPEATRALLESVHDQWGRLDCFVANAGTGSGPTGWDIRESDWDRIFEDNFATTYRMIQQVLPAMTAARQGSIVIVASIVGRESTSAPLPYAAAKAALVNYSKNLARQLGPLNVRVNCVAPGNVLFPGGSWERHLAERRDEVLSLIESEVPLRRFGRPEEIADLIVFLASERAAFITGSCVVADGGQTRSL
jgi:3-oxoacyl-[acyl-carrier protein] reductase